MEIDTEIKLHLTVIQFIISTAVYEWSWYSVAEFRSGQLFLSYSRKQLKRCCRILINFYVHKMPINLGSSSLQTKTVLSISSPLFPFGHWHSSHIWGNIGRALLTTNDLFVHALIPKHKTESEKLPWIWLTFHISFWSWPHTHVRSF